MDINIQCSIYSPWLGMQLKIDLYYHHHHNHNLRRRLRHHRLRKEWPIADILDSLLVDSFTMMTEA